MTPVRASPPRRMGLRNANGRTGRPARGPYPYPVGERIAGEFTITGHLAAGRFGHLYQVWSASEWCAFTCKILAPERRHARASFTAIRREARILKAVRHPNVVRYYGWGEHDGLPFIVLEYLEGPSLFDVLESRPQRRLDVADAVRSAIHIGAALYHLHRKHFLHLDLKPANLVLRESVPVLIDMDAARTTGSRPRSRRLGTGPYMAPEQIQRGKLMPATDVYGLGALLYELLTGRWPFEDVYLSEEPRIGLEREFPQLCGRLPASPRAFEPAVSASLERTVLRCLDPEPTRRQPSMHTLLLDLSTELGDAESLWPIGVRAERRREPRE